MSSLLNISKQKQKYSEREKLHDVKCLHITLKLKFNSNHKYTDISSKFYAKIMTAFYCANLKITVIEAHVPE